MLVYTIVVTYNGLKWMKRCLDSIRNSTVQSIPIVIDNHSTDNTVAFVKENYPEAIVLSQDKNWGFGQANNIGIRYAMERHADYVLLLNQDASLDPFALERLLGQSDGESLFVPIHMNGNGTQMDYAFKHYSLLKSKNNLVDDLILGQCKEKYVIGEVCAACWFLPAKLLQLVGGFNPIFFHYGEDNNFYHRLSYHKVQTYVVPSAFMFHDRNEFGNKNAYKNKLIYRNLLLIATNINLSFSKRLLSYLRLLKECYVQGILHKKYIPFTFFFWVIKIGCNYKQIIRSRQQEKQNNNASWLYTDNLKATDLCRRA